MDQEFLRIGNHRQISRIYSEFLDADEIAKINEQINRHTVLMYGLALDHFLFAVSVRKRQWRQRVSRLYYASYNASKAVRFESDGNHSTDVKDHSKVGHLPQDFPDKSTYENELINLRADRNTCDYDHLAGPEKLVKTPKEYEALVLRFLKDAHSYLSNKGCVLGSAPE